MPEPAGSLKATVTGKLSVACDVPSELTTWLVGGVNRPDGKEGVGIRAIRRLHAQHVTALREVHSEAERGAGDGGIAQVGVGARIEDVDRYGASASSPVRCLCR